MRTTFDGRKERLLASRPAMWVSVIILAVALVLGLAAAARQGWSPWLPQPDLPATATARQVAVAWTTHVAQHHDAAARALMFKPPVIGQLDHHIADATRVDVSESFPAHPQYDQIGFFSRYRAAGVDQFAQVDFTAVGGPASGSTQFLLLGHSQTDGRWLVLERGSSPW